MLVIDGINYPMSMVFHQEVRLKMTRDEFAESIISEIASALRDIVKFKNRKLNI
jgi:hypothetical protein